MEEMLKRVQHDHWVFRHSELVSESNKEEMLKRVQHDLSGLLRRSFHLLLAAT